MNSSPDFVECAECHTLKPFTFFNIVKRTNEDNKEIQTLINTCYECDLNNIIATANKPEYLIDDDFKQLQNALLNTHFRYLNECQMLLNIFKRVYEEENLISTKLGLLPLSIFKIQLFFQSKEKQKVIHQTEEYMQNLKSSIADDIMKVLTRSLYKVDNFEHRIRECLTCQKEGDKVTVCQSCKDIYQEGLKQC
jgi:hypothetical protein